MNSPTSAEDLNPPIPPTPGSARENVGSRSSRRAQTVIVALLIAGLILPHVLIGGVKLLFSIPGYLFLGLAAIGVGVLSYRRIHPGVRLLPILTTCALAGYIFVRSYTSPVEYLARTDRFMVLGALIVYALTAFYLTSAKQRLIVFYWLFALAVVDVGWGLAQFFRNDNLMLLALLPDNPVLPQIFRANYGERASGFLICPNHLAGFLETLGLVAIALACLGRWKPTPRLLMAAIAAVCLAGVAFTGSRGGYLSTATGIVAFLCVLGWVVRKLRPKRFLLILMISIITGTAVVVTAVYLMTSHVFLAERVENVVDPENMRRELWDAALAQFHVSPVLGTGSGTYLYYGRQFRDASVQFDPIHAHNDYLQLLAEYGVVGAVLAGAFLVVHLHAGWRVLARIARKRLRPAKRIFSNEMALIAGTLAALVALLAHSSVDFNCHIPSNALFFAFLFGTLASPSSDPQVIRGSAGRGPRAARIVVPVLGAAAIGLTVPLLAGEFHTEWARVHLRNKEFVDRVFAFHQHVAGVLPVSTARVPFPADRGDFAWPRELTRQQLELAIARAEKGLQFEKRNPDLYFYLGRARYLFAIAQSHAARPEESLQQAVAAFQQAYALFPEDTRVLLSLGRALDDLGRFDEAEKYLAKAIAGDPKLGDVYAYYGYHLWSHRKLTRAEAYYRKALSLDAKSAVAGSGLQAIERLKALAGDANYQDQFGDPLESFDLDPPTAEDELRGIRNDE